MKAMPKKRQFDFDNNQKGQTLLIILMVMGIALSAGVAISSRSIQSLKQQTYTGSSIDSFFAAEAGIEDSLKRLEDPTFPATFTDTNGNGLPDSGDITLDLDDDPTTTETRYLVEMVGGEYEKQIERDITEQLDLSVPDIKAVKIFFNTYDSVGTDEPIITYFLVQQSGGADPVLLEKGLFDPNELDNCNAGSGTNSNTDLGAAPGYGHSIKLPYSTSGFNVAPGDKLILRIRLMCNNSNGTVLIKGYDNYNNPVTEVTLPSQYYKITSTGAVAGTIRKIEATKTLPALPTIFDFVLFSASPDKQLTK